MNGPLLRIGVVGAAPGGFGARAHIPGIKASASLELVGVCTAHEETARAAAARWDVPRWYGSVEALAADPDIDLVTVAVRPRLHEPISEAALRAGKMVYCEWPLATDTAEATRMAELAGSRSLRTAVGLQGRAAPVLRHMRDLVAAGNVGRPVSFTVSQCLSTFEVRSDRAWLAQETEASGALYVASAHVTDAVRFVLGEPESLAGFRATLSPDDTFSDTGDPFRWEASDTVMYLAELAGGVVGSVYVSNICVPQTGFSFTVRGEEGQLEASTPGYYQFTPLSLRRGTREGGFEEVAVPVSSERRIDLPEDHPGTNVARALEEFAEAGRDGLEFHPDFVDGLSLHKIIDAIVTSAETRSWSSP